MEEVKMVEMVTNQQDDDDGDGDDDNQAEPRAKSCKRRKTQKPRKGKGGWRGGEVEGGGGVKKMIIKLEQEL